jgi:glucose/arabinose dehydrogenase
MGNGQNQTALLGKLLRIDVSGTSGNRGYRIPADNPFVGRSSFSEEIWAWGLRNPWRFSWDMQTGALWLADVGQNAVEEIDIITKGGNYGWNTMEGDQCLSGSSCNRDGLTPPVFVYQNSSENCSVTGGYVYRGQSIPELRGAYVYGDYCSGRVWALRSDGIRVTTQGQLADGSFQLSSFGQGRDGEVYALAYGGTGGIFKLVP